MQTSPPSQQVLNISKTVFKDWCLRLLSDILWWSLLWWPWTLPVPVPAGPLLGITFPQPRQQRGTRACISAASLV